MDRTLSYNPHIDQLVGRRTSHVSHIVMRVSHTRMTSHIGLSHARHRLSNETITTFINALVLSIIGYSIGDSTSTCQKHGPSPKSHQLQYFGLSRGGANMTILVTHCVLLPGSPHVNWILTRCACSSSAYWGQAPLVPLAARHSRTGERTQHAIGLQPGFVSKMTRVREANISIRHNSIRFSSFKVPISK